MRPLPLRSACLVVALAILTACTASVNVAGGVNVGNGNKKPPSAKPSEKPDATSVKRGALSGKVLSPDGKPAAGIAVKAYVLSDRGGGVVANNGGSIVSNNSGGILSNNSGKLVGQTRVPYLLQQEGAGSLTATTAADGTFSLDPPADVGKLNVEAVQNDEFKAIALQVAPDGGDLTLTLAPTGTIAGRVSAPGVTNFEGVDVFIPGSSYVAKAAKDGSFTLSNVPPGTFELVARKGLSRASIQVTVRSKQTTQAEALTLALAAPKLVSATPANGGPGLKVVLKGENLGASADETLQVSFNGAIASAKRLDDGTIEVEVPVGAGSGNVVATVGGIPSNGVKFTVLKRLEIAPPLTELVKGDSITYTVRAFDDEDKEVAEPAVTWSLDGVAATLADGKVTAVAAGKAVLKVASGTLSREQTLSVVDRVATVTNFAGTGVSGNQNGPREKATFGRLTGMAFDKAGNMYLVDREFHQIKMIGSDGIVKVIAGTGEATHRDGPALQAALFQPIAIALDERGTVPIMYIAESSGNVISKLVMDPAGFRVEVLAGSPGKEGAVDGKGGQALFKVPHDITLDANGDLYVADWQNHRIRKVLKDGTVTTIAGSGAVGLRDGKGELAQFNLPASITMGPDGNLYVGDGSNHRIRKVTPDGEVTTFAGTTYAFADGPRLQAGFKHVGKVVFDPDGTMFATDLANARIRKITPDGQVSTLAGSGVEGFKDGPGREAQFDGPVYIARGPDGALYVAEWNSFRIRKITR